MFYSLDEIRRKPKSVRQQILLISTTAITLIIVILWLLSFNSHSVAKKDKQVDLSSPNPFSLIKDRITGFYEETLGQINSQ